VKVDNTSPEALLQFDPGSGDISVLGRDALSGTAGVTLVSSVPIAFDQGERTNAELRTYRVGDLAGNTLLLTVNVKKRERELEARAIGLSYNGSVTPIHAVEADFHWALATTGTLKKLDQGIQIGDSEPQQNVEAFFDARRGVTVIRGEEPKPAWRIVRPGLALLGIATHAGALSIDY
jgi:hypothetical protein